jgi:repressor LexA
MTEDWRDRLRKAVHDLKASSGMAVTELSKRAGMDRSYLPGLIAEGSKVTPTITAFLAICEVCDVSPTKILGLDEQSKITIPTIGIASATEEWAPVEGVRDELEFNIQGFDLVGVEVRGSAMAPVYRDQDYLICQRRGGRFAQNLIGSDCLVLTKAGKRYLKILHKGTKPGHFTLRSYNPAARDDVENVALEWVAPVLWIRRGGR